MLLEEKEFRARAQRVKLLVFDVDGVLTNGQVTLDHQGHEIKSFSVRDGFGIRCWQHAGGKTAILTGRQSLAVRHRAADLGINWTIQGARDKRPAFAELLQQAGVGAEETCFLGDDLPDLPLLLSCGLAATVADAVDLVRHHAHWVSRHPGGQGAARELIEALLAAQGHWEQVVTHYTRSLA